MPRACSWSMAMTRPPASGWTAADGQQLLRGPGRARRAATRRRRDSAVRRRWLDRALVEGVVEGGRVLRAVGADPLHVAVDAGEVDGPHDAAVVQGLAVAVLVVGVGLVEAVVVARTGWRRCRSGTGVPESARRRAASSKAMRMPSPHARSSPAWCSSSKITKASWATARSARGLHRHLLVGDDDAVHVGGQAAVARRPLGLEVQVEAGRRRAPTGA